MVFKFGMGIALSERSEALSGRLSKSASELSCSAPVHASPPRARSAHHHTPLSVVHRTHHFFSNLKNRWQRSKSRERCPAGTVLSVAPGADSSGTDYEHSSEPTPANSPLHRIRQVVAMVDGDPLSSNASASSPHCRERDKPKHGRHHKQ
ncbi:unnamed protein product [Pieris macdunnoughi]|uniref:Uncharacterized protein n=1 Tax=Pieris macdunnoughi TaxID=345717 RepID=A0A821MN82_9NEOP|nr:unnamed protein product [Pieris macdunnoughi]